MEVSLFLSLSSFVRKFDDFFALFITPSIHFTERRICGLKKRIEELRSELDVANAELENGKRIKETTDQELKGFEVELSMNETSKQTLEVYFYLYLYVKLQNLHFNTVIFVELCF